jgi:tetratricopeptide (TPR) repeat protein
MTNRQLDEERIFHVARGITDEETRAEYLDQICAGDQALRQRVDALLEVHEKEQSFLKSNGQHAPTVDQSPITEAPGQQIGRYKLLQKIGEGGFGAVYMAEQEAPVRRKVALKIIKLGMDTKQVIARFEAERQALAMMEHANIAKVFDAGATESGRPYFVMELVKGISITDYCDQHNLTTQQRLLLFLDVCHAIHHAHQKGIIHRDVKPTNVMVTLHDGQPVPKVIDFGVSKATNQRLTEKTLFTEYHQFIGTPQYMSPEQAEMSGLDIDTRSDLYSLGALLYEVLTGAPPFEAKTLREAGYAEIQRIIREVEPPKPSTRLETLIQQSTDVAKHHGAEPHSLPKLIRGDLDWIVMKAMEKDRTRRYESASALAQDIERHLQAEPVLAAPPSAGYKLRKFVKRNKAAVSAAAAIALLLVAGTAVSTWQAVRANQARDEAERQAGISQAVSDFLQDDLLGSADPWTGRAEGHTVVSFLDAASKRLEGKFADEPLIEASIRYTFGSTYHHLGRYSEAEKHLKRSLEIRRNQLGNEDLGTLNCKRELGQVYRYWGKNKQAEPLLVEALAGMRRTLPEEHDALLACMGWRAFLYLDQGRYDEAGRLCAEGLEVVQRKLGAEHSWAAIYMHWIAVVKWKQQRFDEAEKLLTEALDIRRRTSGDLDSETLYIIHDLGLLYSDQERYEDAERLLAEALEGRRKVVGEGHPETLRLMGSLGGLYRRQGKFDQAEQLLVECYQKSRETLGEEHPSTSGLVFELVVLYYRQGKTDEMVALLANTVEMMRRGLGDENPMTLHGMYGLGMWYLHIGRDVEAEILLSKALEVRRRVLGAEHPDTQASVGMEYFKQGQYDKAEPLLVKALEDERRMHAGGEFPPLIAIYNLALVHHRLGDYDKAEPLLLELLEISHGVLIEGHPDTVAAMNELIKLYEAWGKPQKAEEWRSKLPGKNGTEEQ